MQLNVPSLEKPLFSSGRESRISMHPNDLDGIEPNFSDDEADIVVPVSPPDNMTSTNNENVQPESENMASADVIVLQKQEVITERESTRSDEILVDDKASAYMDNSQVNAEDNSEKLLTIFREKTTFGYTSGESIENVTKEGSNQGTANVELTKDGNSHDTHKSALTTLLNSPAIKIEESILITNDEEDAEGLTCPGDETLTTYTNEIPNIGTRNENELENAKKHLNDQVNGIAREKSFNHEAVETGDKQFSIEESDKSVENIPKRSDGKEKDEEEEDENSVQYKEKIQSLRQILSKNIQNIAPDLEEETKKTHEEFVIFTERISSGNNSKHDTPEEVWDEISVTDEILEKVVESVHENASLDQIEKAKDTIADYVYKKRIGSSVSPSLSSDVKVPQDTQYLTASCQTKESKHTAEHDRDNEIAGDVDGLDESCFDDNSSLNASYSLDGFNTTGSESGEELERSFGGVEEESSNTDIQKGDPLKDHSVDASKDIIDSVKRESNKSEDVCISKDCISVEQESKSHPNERNPIQRSVKGSKTDELDQEFITDAISKSKLTDENCTKKQNDFSPLVQKRKLRLAGIKKSSSKTDKSSKQLFTEDISKNVEVSRNQHKNIPRKVNRMPNKNGYSDCSKVNGTSSGVKHSHVTRPPNHRGNVIRLPSIKRESNCSSYPSSLSIYMHKDLPRRTAQNRTTVAYSAVSHKDDLRKIKQDMKGKKTESNKSFHRTKNVIRSNESGSQQPLAECAQTGEKHQKINSRANIDSLPPNISGQTKDYPATHRENVTTVSDSDHGDDNHERQNQAESKKSEERKCSHTCRQCIKRKLVKRAIIKQHTLHGYDCTVHYSKKQIENDSSLKKTKCPDHTRTLDSRENCQQSCDFMSRKNASMGTGGSVSIVHKHAKDVPYATDNYTMAQHRSEKRRATYETTTTGSRGYKISPEVNRTLLRKPINKTAIL